MDYFKTVDPEDMSQAKLIVFEKGLLPAPNSLFYLFHLSKEPITFILGNVTKSNTLGGFHLPLYQ